MFEGARAIYEEGWGGGRANGHGHAVVNVRVRRLLGSGGGEALADNGRAVEQAAAGTALHRGPRTDHGGEHDALSLSLLQSLAVVATLAEARQVCKSRRGCEPGEPGGKTTAGGYVFHTKVLFLSQAKRTAGHKLSSRSRALLAKRRATKQQQGLRLL